MVKRVFALVAAFVIALSSFAFGDIKTARAADPLSYDTEWVPAYPYNDQNDARQDQQTGSGSVSQDIVGDGSYYSTYMRLTTSDISFRIRLSNIDGDSPYSFKNFAFVGIDADCSGSVDYFLGVYNPTGNNGRVGIYSAASGYANTSPSTTGISGKPLMAFKPVDDVNYAITRANDGSFFNDDDDYFISFKFSLDDIAAATGWAVTSSTPFQFMTGTAAQDNSFNQDLNGMDETGWSSSLTWDELGVFSDIYTVGGTMTYSKVTFDKNTGDTNADPQTMAVQTGSVLGSLPDVNPTKRGMYFQEWNTAPDGSGSKVTTDTEIKGDVTFYAIWSSSDVCTVTFDPNGGTLNGPSTVPTINGIVGDNMPAPPTKAGDYFMGWQIQSTTTYFNSTTPVAANITVVAQWVNKETKVARFFDNYNDTGGTEIAKVYSNGQSNNFNGTLPVIIRPGYTFGGWYLNDTTCSGSPVSDIGAEGSYYAKWTEATYTVTFDQNYSGAPAAATQPATDGVIGTLPTDPARENYKFIEWNRNAAGSGEPMYPTSVITADTTLYAKWAYIQNVTFHANGGQFDDPINKTTWQTTATDGTLALQPQPPARAGYTFLGWGIANNSTTPVSLLDVSAHNDYYAIWSPVKTVTFNENYGTSPAESTVLTAYGSVLYIPTAPARTSYTFDGWNTDLGGTGSAFTLSYNVEDNMTVYAQWHLSGTAYTVSFVTNGGSSVADLTTTQIASQPASTKTGYTLKGWYTEAELTNKVSFPYDVTADKTLYADWTPNTYTVEYNGNGGDSGTTASSSHTYDVAKALTANGFTHQYYNFAGWSDTSGGSVKYSNSESVSNLTATNGGTVTLYAKWQPNTYTVVYNGNENDGGSTASSSHTCGVSKALTTNGFTRSGFTFAGWALTPGGTTQYTDEEFVVNLTETNGGTVNLYAVWETESEATYRASFVTNGGSAIADITTDEILNKPVSTRDGYTLKDWYTDETLTTKASFPYTLVEDKVFYAEWTPNTYTVVYNGNGSDGGTTASSDHTYDVSKALTSNGFTRRYYTFAGWAETAGGSVKYSNSESVKNLTAVNDGSVTLYAKWQPNIYTVVYNGNGSDGGSTATSSHTCDVPKALTLNGFTRSGYAFTGWAFSAGASVQYTDGQSVVNLSDANGATVNLYAVWVAQPILSSSDEDGIISEDGRVTLTPNMPGGTWGYDPEYLRFDGTTFTAIKPGTTIVTYTINGVTVQYIVTVKVSALPSTGQDFTWMFVLIGTAASLLVGAFVLRKSVGLSK